MSITVTGDGPKITATGSGSTVLVEISTGQHDPGSFSGVHNDLSGRSTAAAHPGTAVSIDPTGFNGNLDGTIVNAQLLAAAVDDIAGGGGGGATTLNGLDDVVITAAASGDILRHNGTNWVDTPGTTHYDAAGTAASAVAALSSVYQPLDSDLTAIAALSTTSYGRAFLALADAAAGRTALGLGTAATSASGDFQPVDSDLTAIAALSTTSYGRAFLALADAAAGRTALGLGTAAVAATGDFEAAGAVSAHTGDTSAAHAATAVSYTPTTTGDWPGTDPDDVGEAFDKIGERLTDSVKGFVNHGATAGTTRPAGYVSVEWYGTVEPTNAVEGDTWNSPS